MPRGRNREQGPSSDDAAETAAGEFAAVLLIDRHEDIAAICGRLDSAPTFSVVLHAPHGNASLATDYGIRRLHRHAEESGHTVAIATGNRSLATRAISAGFAVARNPVDVRWDRPGRTLFKVGSRSLPLPTLGPLPGIVAIIIGVATIIAVFLFVAPSATVVVTLSGEQLARETEVTVTQDGTAEDLDSGVVASRPVTVAESVVLAVPATGTASVGVKPAVVTISVSATGSGARIPAGAIALAGTVRFRVGEGLALGPGETKTLTATALVAGTVGNVAAGAVSRWEDTSLGHIKVTNPAAAADGTDVASAAVAEDDIKLAQARAQGLARSPAMRDLLVKAHPGELVLTDTIEIEVESDEALTPVGSAADLALVEVRLIVRGDAVPASTVAALAERMFRTDDRSVLPGSVSIRQTGAALAAEGGVLARVEVTAVGVSPIERDAVRDLIKGKRPGSAKASLASRYRMDDVDIRLTPGWAPFIPRFGARIDLELHESSGGTLETSAGS